MVYDFLFLRFFFFLFYRLSRFFYGAAESAEVCYFLCGGGYFSFYFVDLFLFVIFFEEKFAAFVALKFVFECFYFVYARAAVFAFEEVFFFFFGKLFGVRGNLFLFEVDE